MDEMRDGAWGGHVLEKCQRVCVKGPFKGLVPGQVYHVVGCGCRIRDGYHVTPDVGKIALPDAFPVAMKQLCVTISYKVVVVLILGPRYCILKPNEKEWDETWPVTRTGTHMHSAQPPAP